MSIPQPLRVLLISSVVPEPGSLGGALIMERYLFRNPHVTAHVFHQPTLSLRARCYGILKRTALRKWIAHVEHFLPCLPSASTVDEAIIAFQPDIILTVAHGWLYIAAMDAAKRQQLPLVAFFQDWWPAIAQGNVVADIHFRRLARECTKAICVSEGMIERLGNPAHASLLHDPPSALHNLPSRTGTALRTVGYFGNLSEYGPMVERAVREGRQEGVTFIIHGPRPSWTEATRKEFENDGTYRGLASPATLSETASGLDAALVVMSFDPAMRNRMETSFPSKFAEALQFDLPVIIWAPEYSSICRFARQHQAAFVITDSSPGAFRRGLGQLINDRPLQAEVLEGARRVRDTFLNADVIMQQFNQILDDVMTRKTALQ